MRVWKHLPLLGLGLLAACSSPGALDVRPYHIREVSLKGDGEAWIDSEEMRRMYGAVGVREQEQRLGIYYDIYWEDDAVGGPVRVVFEYQQAATASKVLKKVQDFSAETRKGKAEFQIIGDDYLEGGRVLAWKCTLLRGGEAVSSRQSYLWE
ncbi:hypothetical protein ACFQY0_02925 [Haloferula chungangensis]|uniref:Lipoprotein n=1 Tax=Haloferula chungangensis TaxID=1048331 RepID=A0ABW2L484_9BACT